MIKPVYSKLAETVYTINNANRPWGTLIEEIPTDIGRSYAGYKRGGILEGAEKIRKELMTAAVWMAGIPAFNKLGNLFCEHVLKIPTKIAYSNSKEGNAAIENSINYLKGNTSYFEDKKINLKELDVSEIEHYKKTLASKLDKTTVEKMVAQVKGAKQVTSIAAVILNCLALGVILPKFNQKITQKKIDKQKTKQVEIKTPTINEYIAEKEKKTSSNVSFTGGIIDKATYLTENSNTFRLVVTDIPMIIGRMATSRNKYEALEFLVMDGGSIFFYNFCAGLVQKFLRKASHVPDINPKAAEIIAQTPKEELTNALKLLEKGEKTTKTLFSKETSDLIYKEATYGRYGKINKFVKENEIKGIDDGVVKTLEYFKKAAKNMNSELMSEGKINPQTLQKVVKKTAKDINKANALYLACGLGLSILGLAVIIPKLTFAITEKLTGKNQFTGIANYDDNKDNVKKG